MLVSAVKDATTHVRTVLRAGFHWRRFHIDDTGYGDLEGEREQRTIQIRFSAVPESMIDALHGIRAVEQQFGRIRDYRLLRDSEMRSEYQAMCWAAFESPRSLLHIPTHGATLKIVLPPSLGRPEGGLGLDELSDLLVSENLRKPNGTDSLYEPNKPARFVTLKIKRADAPITFRSTLKPPFRSRAMKAAIGHEFLGWGGFAPLQPLYASSPFSSPAQDQNLPPLDNKNMRMALNKWSQILGVADPLFPEMKQPDGVETPDKGPESDWEPMSEPLWMPSKGADAAEQFELPRGAQESLKQSLESLLQRGTDDSDAVRG